MQSIDKRASLVLEKHRKLSRVLGHLCEIDGNWVAHHLAAECIEAELLDNLKLAWVKLDRLLVKVNQEVKRRAKGGA